MKFVIALAFLSLFGVIACQESTPPRPLASESSTQDPLGQLVGLEGFVKSFIQAFELLMRSLSNVRGLFVGLGQEVARITYNNTGPTQPIIPAVHMLMYQARQDEDEASRPIETLESTTTQGPSIPIPAVLTRFANIYQRWLEETSTAVGSLFRELLSIYQTGLTQLIQRGQVTRDQVLQGFLALRKNVEYLGGAITTMVPASVNLNNTFNNVIAEMNNNITQLLEALRPSTDSSESVTTTVPIVA